MGETLIAAVEELNSVYQTFESDTFRSSFTGLNHYLVDLLYLQSINTHGGQNLPKRRFKSYWCTQVNNTIGQALLAKHISKIIAETGAGQHGVASATVAARLGLEVMFTWAPRI